MSYPTAPRKQFDMIEMDRVKTHVLPELRRACRQLENDPTPGHRKPSHISIDWQSLADVLDAISFQADEIAMNHRGTPPRSVPFEHVPTKTIWTRADEYAEGPYMDKYHKQLASRAWFEGYHAALRDIQEKAK